MESISDGMSPGNGRGGGGGMSLISSATKLWSSLVKSPPVRPLPNFFESQSEPASPKSCMTGSLPPLLISLIILRCCLSSLSRSKSKALNLPRVPPNMVLSVGRVTSGSNPNQNNLS